MSRFADRSVTERYVLGPCECEGTPHAEDYLDLRTQLSGLELATMEGSGLVERLQVLVVGWNLIEGGAIAPLDADHLERLSLPTLNRITAWWSERAEGFALPNGSAAPSRSSKRASGSPTRTPKTAA